MHTKQINRGQKTLLALMAVLMLTTGVLSACSGEGMQLDLNVSEGDNGLDISGGITEGAEQAAETASSNESFLFILLLFVFFSIIMVIVAAGRRGG